MSSQLRNRHAFGHLWSPTAILFFDIRVPRSAKLSPFLASGFANAKLSSLLDVGVRQLRNYRIFWGVYLEVHGTY